MNTRGFFPVSATLLISVAFGAAHADDSPRRGATIYGACAACHSLEPNLHLTGPSLAGVFGKKAASVAGFPRYSSALRHQDLVWDENTLNAWLANPRTFVPGTYMTFRGIEDGKARGDLIAFLKMAMGPDGANSVVAQGLVSAEVARGQAPEPLANAGPEDRVTGIRHCQNTFFLATADGKQHPFWEMNLRLKIDSSSTGPKPGEPVLVAGGMQGDRASVVFSDWAEIGRLIEKTADSNQMRCPD